MRSLRIKTLWAKVRDIIRATFDRKIFESWVEKLKERTRIKIGKPIEAVNNIVKLVGLSEEQRQTLLMYFSEQTKYGLVNKCRSESSE